MNHSVTADAPGKINLYFEVGSLQPDGYHDVASVYLALGLRERVSLSPADAWSVSVEGSLSSSQLAGVPTGEDNLVVRAAKLVSALAETQPAHPVHFQIDKSVPVAGGMGGGSADAAAALLAANDLYCSGITTSALMKQAGELGADVPFALMGGVAVGTGRGDALEAIEQVKTTHWVLVPHDGGLSTPSVYQKLDALRVSRGLDPAALPAPSIPAGLIEALQSGDAHELAKHIRNDLEECSIQAIPELAKTISDGVAAGALAGMVSGSGPTVAFLAESPDMAEVIANNLSVLGYEALVTYGPSEGANLEKN